MSKHKITFLDSGTVNGTDWEAKYEVTFEYRAGRPAVWTLRNGDPGYPADPDEIEAIDIKSEFGSLDAREKAAALDRAQAWLDSDGSAEAMLIVAEDGEAAFDYAADLRSER